MIGQYLPQTNESATVAKCEIFSKLNKAKKKSYSYLQLQEELGAPLPLHREPNRAAGCMRHAHVARVHTHVMLPWRWRPLIAGDDGRPHLIQNLKS